MANLLKADPAGQVCGHVPCGKVLTRANHSGFCAKHFSDSKRKSAGKPTRDKHCTACGAKIRRDNACGLCKACKAKAPKNFEQFKARSSGRGLSPRGPGPELPKRFYAAALNVTQLQIIEMFSAWSFTDQVACVQLWLDQ